MNWFYILFKEIVRKLLYTFSCKGGDRYEFENGKYIELDTSVHNIYTAIAPEHNREEYVEQGAKVFIDEFTDRNPDFTPTFEVKRDDLNVVYKSAEGEIIPTYNEKDDRTTT